MSNIPGKREGMKRRQPGIVVGFDCVQLARLYSWTVYYTLKGSVSQEYNFSSINVPFSVSMAEPNGCVMLHRMTKNISG